jgi:hypothetical protein
MGNTVAPNPSTKIAIRKITITGMMFTLFLMGSSWAQRGLISFSKRDATGRKYRLRRHYGGGSAETFLRPNSIYNRSLTGPAETANRTAYSSLGGGRPQPVNQ